MPNKFRIVLAQLNFKVGDINGNLEKHIAAARKAKDVLSADAILFPELSLTGYPPEDLLLRKSFIEDAKSALQKLTRTTRDIYCFVGHPDLQRNHLYNACSLIYNGKIFGTYHKQCLPNYSVFDEARYFVPGDSPSLFHINNIPISVIICEDIWRIGPTKEAVDAGAKLILVPNASPFELNKHDQRMSLLIKRATYNHVSILYVNQVGGQDELIFDGGSMAINSRGILCQFAGFFNEVLLPVDIETTDHRVKINKDHNLLLTLSQEERTYQGLVLSLHDYITKNNFPGVLIGVSGGIDSALTLCIAVDALGKDRVHAVMMPSRYTADISLKDAKELIENLGVTSEIIDIEPTYQSFLSSLSESFKGKKPDVTEENIQARCRAIILMALSNKFGYLVLSTGNRSELAVGYCTLYGDMAGGFAVLKDIPKTLVYKLAAYRNQLQSVIPQRTIDRAPTAELAPNQKDEDSLPPYPLLDKILDLYLNQGLSKEKIIKLGFDKKSVEKIVKLIHQNEYKRKQSAIGPRTNHHSFGKDWRYPITNGHDD
jgi:NAD+ synthase (glutamine-hydrolysing)